MNETEDLRRSNRLKKGQAADPPTTTDKDNDNNQKTMVGHDKLESDLRNIHELVHVDNMIPNVATNITNNHFFDATQQSQHKDTSHTTSALQALAR